MKRISHFLKIVLQIVALVLVWLSADWLARALSLPVPAGVLGLAAIILMMLAGWLPLDYVRLGAEWLLAEMMLFFVPALVSLTRFGDLMVHRGPVLVVVCLIGCLIVMAGTGLVVDRVYRHERRRHQARLATLAKGCRE